MSEPQSAKRPRNWWIFAFIVAALAFELTREMLVLTSAQGPRPGARGFVYGDQTFVQAEGTWQRIDGGEQVLPGIVTIQCLSETSSCIEASTTFMDDVIPGIDVTVFDAEFTSDSVSYTNDLPNCVNYVVRIDLKLKKAFSVRQTKKNEKSDLCSGLEPRIEMQLSNGFDVGKGLNPMDGHFVPLLRALSGLFNAFG